MSKRALEETFVINDIFVVCIATFNDTVHVN